jgi:hypothetical protein
MTKASLYAAAQHDSALTQSIADTVWPSGIRICDACHVSPPFWVKAMPPAVVGYTQSRASPHHPGASYSFLQ